MPGLVTMWLSLLCNYQSAQLFGFARSCTDPAMHRQHLLCTESMIAPCTAMCIAACEYKITKAHPTPEYGRFRGLLHDRAPRAQVGVQDAVQEPGDDPFGRAQRDASGVPGRSQQRYVNA